MTHRILFLLLLAVACTPPDHRQQAETAIRDADLAMSADAVQNGFHKTLLAYADTAVVKYEDGRLPIIGKTALEAYYQEQGDTKALSWKPFKAEAARSGDLGYSLGYWKYTTPDTTLYGNYYTIWKKQADGSWKFVLDGGGSTPEPDDSALPPL